MIVVEVIKMRWKIWLGGAETWLIKAHAITTFMCKNNHVVPCNLHTARASRISMYYYTVTKQSEDFNWTTCNCSRCIYMMDAMSPAITRQAFTKYCCIFCRIFMRRCSRDHNCVILYWIKYRSTSCFHANIPSTINSGPE